MQEVYQVETRPIALKENQIIGEKYRITMLTEALIRLEYDEEGKFEDRATQMVFIEIFHRWIIVSYEKKMELKCILQTFI